MVVDTASRARLFEDRKTKALVEGMKDAIITAVGTKNTTESSNGLNLVVKHEDDQTTHTSLQKIGNALALIYKIIPKQIVLPKIFRIEGKVDVDNVPDVTVHNLDELAKYFKSLETKISSLAQAISSVPQQKIEVPKFEIPKELLRPSSGNSDVVEALQRLERALDKIPQPKTKFPEHISVDNFPPQLTPQPVTHMSINALHGGFKATTMNVGTSATALPQSSLAQRRSIILFNNSVNTIYIGDANIATAGGGMGLPVPTQTYSPTMDAGWDMVLYGIASTSSSVTILEMSEENSGR